MEALVPDTLVAGQGMTLFFNCIKCGNRWRDYV